METIGEFGKKKVVKVYKKTIETDINHEEQNENLKKSGKTGRMVSSTTTKMAKVDKLMNNIAVESLEKMGEQHEQAFKHIIFALLLIGLAFMAVFPHSGQNDPPKFGDYEAQRHWMEITINLRPSQWYVNSTSNDILYWGLDYPPLTAYHSYVLGRIAHFINPSWVALYSSRGMETNDHKCFMRLTVMATMLSLYYYVLLDLFKGLKNQENKHIYYLTIALFPGLLYVDGAHFQYNHICLALALKAFLCFTNRKVIVGSILFVLALNFKQMALYYSLPVFIFLLSNAFKGGFFKGCWNVAQLGITVIATFLVLWYPFLTKDLALQVLHRIFPVARGLFEDKVATFWCVISIVYKFRGWPNHVLFGLSNVLTLSMCLPALYILFRRPTDKLFKFALFICSMTFFLFSFQVHEKTIIFVAVPAFLLLQYEPALLSSFLFDASASMFPLIAHEKSYHMFPLFFAYHLFNITFNPPSTTLLAIGVHIKSIIYAILALLFTFIPPPTSYPYLWHLAFAAWSFLCFSIYYSYMYYQMGMEYGNLRKLESLKKSK